MDIFSVFTLCGGLAFFLYGMNTMSKSLEKMAGGKLERLLKRMTSNPVKSLLLGAGITIAIQSSSAMTVMLVGLVNSGVMELGQTIGVIMGSNIGTTLTAWILSLTGIQSESIFVNMLKPENFSPLVALAGIILIMGSKRQKRRDVGRIIMGQNIGTCVTALLSSIGVNRNAKRVAVIHISFNVIGTVVCLVLFYGGNLIFDFSFMDWTVGAVGIAFCHTVFNVFTTLMLLPFSRQLEKLARRLIRTENPAKEFAFLDPLLIRTPSVAISECVSMACRMGETARDNVLLAMEQLSGFSEEREAQILENEDKLDTYEDRLGSYLVEVSQHGVSMADIRTVSRLLHAIGDFERIGDHAINIQDSARELQEKELRFSPTAEKELQVLGTALEDILFQAVSSFNQDDPAAAKAVEPLEETIDQLTEEIRMRHIQRLQTGECTIQLGFVLNDLLTNLERVSDHCSNIAVCVIEERDSSVDHHAYLHRLKVDDNFAEELREDLSKYRLPNA